MLSVDGDALCYCRQKKPGNETITCSKSECPIKVFHCSCLTVKKQDITKTWYCSTCSTLPTNKRGKSKAKALNSAAIALSSICVCNQKAMPTDRLLECQEKNCPHGKFFHLGCLNYKRRPNNSINWRCSKCKSNAKIMPDDRKPKDVSSRNSTVQKPVSPVLLPLPTIPSPISTQSSTVDSESDSDSSDQELELVKVAHVKSNTRDSISSLTCSDYDLIISPTGWLNCDIIQEAHICLQRVNPLIDGFQQPTLGPCRNFDIMTSVSSIDCTPGTIKLYDSLYNDIIEDEVKAQVESLVADSNVATENVPVQQQLNGFDCGVFAVAFATCLVYGTKPDNINFDLSKIRQHLYDCLKNNQITPFPFI